MKIDISMKWQQMSQEEIYLQTNEPNPQEAISKANTNKFHDNSAAYVFNNEPAQTLEKIMNYKDKKALGVACSGDQPFIFLSLGLKEYLAFDISQVACFWVELKRAAILNLSRREFSHFILGEGEDNNEPSSFSKSSCKTHSGVYNALREQLSHYAQQFFDNVIKNKESIKDLLDHSSFFRGVCFSECRVPYLMDDTNYQKLKQNMKDSAFKVVWKGIDEAMGITPQETYDVIFVSNILDRWKTFGNSFTKTLSLMKERLSPNNKSRIIGNYQLGYDVAGDIKSAANKTGLLFTPHCKDADDYWTLQCK